MDHTWLTSAETVFYLPTHAPTVRSAGCRAYPTKAVLGAFAPPNGPRCPQLQAAARRTRRPHGTAAWIAPALSTVQQFVTAAASATGKMPRVCGDIRSTWLRLEASCAWATSFECSGNLLSRRRVVGCGKSSWGTAASRRRALAPALLRKTRARAVALSRQVASWQVSNHNARTSARAHTNDPTHALGWGEGSDSGGVQQIHYKDPASRLGCCAVLVVVGLRWVPTVAGAHPGLARLTCWGSYASCLPAESLV